MARPSRRPLFPINVWPPFVDAVTLVLVAFVLVVLVVLLAQRGLVHRLTERERELVKLKEDKERVERRLRALAQTGLVEVVDGKVILQGEVLFGSGSADVTADGQARVAALAAPLAALLEAEPDQMVLVGGHTDDRPIKTAQFASNWQLSTGARGRGRQHAAGGRPAGEPSGRGGLRRAPSARAQPRRRRPAAQPPHRDPARAGAFGVERAGRRCTLTSAYANTLLRHASRVLHVAPDADLSAALDGFLAAPGPASFVAASRALAALHREHAHRRLLARHDDRLFRRGLDALRAARGLDPAQLEALAALPADARTGQRLLALARLIEAHAELAGRAAAAFREIRRKLESAAAPVAARTWRD